MRNLTTLCVMCFVCVSAKPQDNVTTTFVSGNDLYQWCQSEGEPHARCAGYIIGAADSFSMTSASQGLRWEPPSQITTGQIIDIAVRYLKEHPEERHLQAASLVWSALEQTWPPHRKLRKEGKP
jgi:hypothetical protein